MDLPNDENVFHALTLLAALSSAQKADKKAKKKAFVWKKVTRLRPGVKPAKKRGTKK